MQLDLANRVFILTGASKGLGYAAAQCLVADGARVVVSSTNPENVAAATARLNALARPEPSPGDRRTGLGAEVAHGIVANLADASTPQRLIDAALSAFGRIDGALISVGGPPRTTAAGATDEQWRTAFETVFLGSVRAARTVLNALTISGAVGLVLSSSAKDPITGLGLSNGLRPGLAGVIKDMADEYGPSGKRIFGLLPHRILTDRNLELFAATGDAAQAQAQAEAAIPLRRLGQPEEFGRVAAFLLSPAASYLTGLCVPIDGGAMRGL